MCLRFAYVRIKNDMHVIECRLFEFNQCVSRAARLHGGRDAAGGGRARAQARSTPLCAKSVIVEG